MRVESNGIVPFHVDSFRETKPFSFKPEGLASASAPKSKCAYRSSTALGMIALSGPLALRRGNGHLAEDAMVLSSPLLPA